MPSESSIPGTALVTGSARRVGRAIAAGLIERGWHVVVHAREEAPAQLAAGELGAVAGIGADLRDAPQCTMLIARALDELGGKLDLLVNNAASFVRKRPLDTTSDDWAEAMDLNARAPLLLVQAAAPALRAARGTVINISDRAAHEHWLEFAAHSASKAALDSLTVTLARELHPDVRVNSIVPGTVLPPDDASAEWVDRKRRAGDLGSPQQVVDAITRLIDDPLATGEFVLL